MARNVVSDEQKAKLAENVKHRRHRGGLTQLELALEAGVTPSTIYWLEREGRASLGTIEAVAKALACTTAKLLA